MGSVKASIYVETTIVSYLAARPSHDIIVRAHQELTRRWWRQRGAFELFASPLVKLVHEGGYVGDAALCVISDSSPTHALA